MAGKLCSCSQPTIWLSHTFNLWLHRNCVKWYRFCIYFKEKLGFILRKKFFFPSYVIFSRQMLYSCLIFFLLLFNLMMLFILQLLDCQGVISFHSKPTPHPPCCSEWVWGCCPGTAYPAHPACSSHPAHHAVGGFKVQSKLPWLAVERHGELLYPKTAQYWVSQSLGELFHLSAHMYLLCCSLPHQ